MLACGYSYDMLGIGRRDLRFGLAGSEGDKRVGNPEHTRILEKSVYSRVEGQSFQYFMILG